MMFILHDSQWHLKMVQNRNIIKELMCNVIKPQMSETLINTFITKSCVSHYIRDQQSNCVSLTVRLKARMLQR